MAGVPSDSSSEDEEEQAKLREASFGTSSIFSESLKKNGTTASKNEEQIKKPSLRSSFEQEEDHTLKTTPEFRAHVAKKLSSVLDGCLEMRNGSPKQSSKSQDSDSSDELSFKLFSSSKPEDMKTAQNQVNARAEAKRKASSSSSEDEEMFSCVAVSGQYILDGAKTTFTEMATPSETRELESDQPNKNSLKQQTKGESKHKNGEKEKISQLNNGANPGLTVKSKKPKKKRKRERNTDVPD